jgi:hypothetical protein
MGSTRPVLRNLIYWRIKMALTLTEDFRMEAGGRKFRFITVTHDESTSTFTAASVGLDQFEFFIAGTPYLASTAADVSALVGATDISIVGDNDTIKFGLPPKVASTTRLMLIGW